MTSIVMTIPSPLVDRLTRPIPDPCGIYHAFVKLFASAKREVKVLMPYVDPTFTALLAQTHAPVYVVTSVCPGRTGRGLPSPVLERASVVRDLSVRYLGARSQGSMAFDMRAHAVISDRRIAYVGSAAITDTASHYAVELGLLIEEAHAVRELDELFDRLFRIGLRADEL